MSDMSDLNVEHDYAAPLIRAQQCVTACHYALIDKRDLEAAYVAAKALASAATDVVTAIIYHRLKDKLQGRRPNTGDMGPM